MKFIAALLLALVPFLGASAQEQSAATPTDTPTVTVPQFGYLSYNAVFAQMPDYQKAKEDFAALKAQYDAEATRAEEEFQRKFTEFLQGQKDFPKSIMQKRQAELQELMDKSVAFRKEAQRLLAEAEAKLRPSAPWLPNGDSSSCSTPMATPYPSSIPRLAWTSPKLFSHS